MIVLDTNDERNKLITEQINDHVAPSESTYKIFHLVFLERSLNCTFLEIILPENLHTRLCVDVLFQQE